MLLTHGHEAPPVDPRDEPDPAILVPVEEPAAPGAAHPGANHRFAYAASVRSGDMHVIDLALPARTCALETEIFPYRLATADNGGRLLVTERRRGLPARFDVATTRRLGEIAVGGRPDGVAVDRARRRAVRPIPALIRH